MSSRLFSQPSSRPTENGLGQEFRIAQYISLSARNVPDDGPVDAKISSHTIELYHAVDYLTQLLDLYTGWRTC
jgi:hypothetical protein